MPKLIFSFILVLTVITADAQSRLLGEYTASAFEIDSVMQIMKLSLKPDGTYTIISTYYNATGEWKQSRRKIMLKPNFVTSGCFVLENKKETLLIHNDSLVLKEKSTSRSRKIEKQLSKSAGEKVKTITEETASIVFCKIY